jgi:hypothetical protein
MIVDDVEHSVVANPESVAFPSLQFTTAQRPRGAFQDKNRFTEPSMNRLWQSVHFSLCRLLDFDRVSHPTLDLSALSGSHGMGGTIHPSSPQ